MSLAASRPTRRVHTPTVLQMEMVECGAAALAIVLAYWGRRVPLEELRVACGISRDGSKASSILRAARGYGLEAKGFRRDVDEVLEGPFPSIVFWNFNHFLVVEGASRDKVFLNDPALGPRTVTRDEFGKSFTGVALEMKPGEGFTRGGPPERLLARLRQRLSGFEPAIAFVAWISLMLVIPGLIVPGFTRIFVDDILVKQFDGWLGPLLVGMAAIFILNALLSTVQQLMLLRIELRLALEQSARFVWHVLCLPVEFFGQRFSGDLVNRVEANDRVAELLAVDLGNAAASLLTAAFLGVAMMFYDVTLAAIALGGAALSAVVLRVVNRPMKDVALRLQTEQGKLFATSVVGLQTIETLKAGGGENDFFSKWAGYHARAINSEQKLTIYQQVTNLVPPIVSSFVNAAVLGVGALLVIDGTITVGTLVGFQALLGNFSGPVQHVVGVAAKVQQASADLARLDDVLHYRRDWRFPTEPAPASEAHAVGRLSMQNVSFGYSPFEPPLIEGFSLDVAPGRWVALVGESGSGKSTLGTLITGLNEPRGGAVRVDGLTLAEWGRKRLAHVVASVDQDIHLFKGTLRENITLWDSTVPQARLAAAIADAGLTEVVQSLPRNFEAAIDEDGRNLNGGQRQRIEIARALVQEPAILVLDEATSALDAISENEILQAVRRRGMTCVLVAHRLSTIRDCDEIIVLARGKVVERGNHARLLAAGGAYARLISAETAT
ncbi:MAG: NHLP family bacteriocin export ABC transporter peptidase/permease/ATPase subunit [Reyranella sp.]|nr:NHLP family bacteriocin export ABC transporter peptidase/permease/ATPase subunit [Reyranella sp.]